MNEEHIFPKKWCKGCNEEKVRILHFNQRSAICKQCAHDEYVKKRRVQHNALGKAWSAFRIGHKAPQAIIDACRPLSTMITPPGGKKCVS